MGFFNRSSSGTPRGQKPCPICSEVVPKDDLKLSGDHLGTHVHQIASGEGAGSYTFRCSCGPADMYWADEFKALCGLAVHLQQKHGVYDVI